MATIIRNETRTSQIHSILILLMSMFTMPNLAFSQYIIPTDLKVRTVGLRGVALDPKARKTLHALKRKTALRKGLLITGLSPFGTAKQAGLRKYDIISVFNKHRITTAKQFITIMHSMEPDKTFPLIGNC